MAGTKRQTLRQQAHDQIADAALLLEQKVARALIDGGEFVGVFTADELAVVMRKVLYTLVDDQKVAGVDVPLLHNVTRMDVDIAGGEAAVSCELHIHAPIKAFITFDYVLENDTCADSGRLRLKDNEVTVKEVTRPLDIAARTALKVMNVRHITMREMNDINGIIRRTLPAQLRQQGFEGELSTVELELRESDAMAIYLAAE
jgi:hypothetical protein